MYVLKKTALAFFAFASSTVFAGTMGTTCTPGNVTVPCATFAWDISGQALYLQTTFNKDFSYYPSGQNSIYNDLSGHWDWGFQLATSYHFNAGNDIKINWYHLDANKKRFDFNPLGFFSPFNLLLDVKNQWDGVNGEFGQLVNFNEASQIRFHGGFHYTHLKTSSEAVLNSSNDFFFDEEETAPTLISHTAFNTEYNGFGPRIGLDMNYFLGDGFTMYANLATALLAGRGHFHDWGLITTQNELDINPGLLPVTVRGARTQIVPEIDAKVGGTYTYSWAHGNLILDVGYLWFNYFNAFSNQNILSNIQLNQTLNKGVEHSDFGASGPYFGLKYVGNI